MPTMPRLGKSQPLSDFVGALEKYGCVIVTNFTDPAMVTQANKEVEPWLTDQGKEGARVGGKAPIRHCSHRTVL